MIINGFSILGDRDGNKICLAAVKIPRAVEDGTNVALKAVSRVATVPNSSLAVLMQQNKIAIAPVK